MRSRNLIILITTLFLLTATAFGQTSWLDRPLNRNWNTGDGVIPQPPRGAGMDARCREQVRAPESLADRAVTRAGWSLFGASQTYGPATIVLAMAGADGQCRPNEYNGFVFVNNRFAGTLSPTNVNARSDGAFGRVQLFNLQNLSAEFVRYTSSDPLCCPSQTSTVMYSITTGARPIVKADSVNTEKNCNTDGGDVGTQDNVVSGTVTYRQRVALPSAAVLYVRLLDVSRADAPAITVAEDRIEMAGKQVPVSFEFAYDRVKIQERNRYVIRAEIRDGERLLFTTDTSYPVITQSNPKTVEIVLAQVGGGGGGGGQRDNLIRGTVTYRQRSAMPPNSQVVVKLVDSADTTGKAVAETTVSTLNRQVPIAFELPYEMRDINRQRNYELQAEIRSAGVLRFKTAAGVPVTIRGNNQNDSIELVVVPSTEGPEAITGKTLSLSKIGVGNIVIGGRSAILITGNVTVRTDGTADVSLTRSNGPVVFTGKLTYFDANTLRITISNSGDADASGEIEIRYNGRSLTSVAARSLVMDSQDVTIRF